MCFYGSTSSRGLAPPGARVSYADEPEGDLLLRFNLPPPTQKIRGESYGGLKLVPNDQPDSFALGPLYSRGHPSRRIYATYGFRLALTRCR